MDTFKKEKKKRLTLGRKVVWYLSISGCDCRTYFIMVLAPFYIGGFNFKLGCLNLSVHSSNLVYFVGVRMFACVRIHVADKSEWKTEIKVI